MKFALRDDDLNFFFKPASIQENLGEIWDICPVSMSVVPFVMGNWDNYIALLGEHVPGNLSEKSLDLIQKDKRKFDIADNTILVDYIRKKIIEGKVYLTLHGIHHRNDDPLLPVIANNYSIGAEFFTTRDLTEELLKAKNHVEQIFSQSIKVFTPPQNLYNLNGFSAVESCGLNICGYPPSPIENVRELLNILKLSDYAKIVAHKISKKRNSKLPYKNLLPMGKIKIYDHWALQPGSDLNILYSDFHKAYSSGSNFVLSTHSYGFKDPMLNESFSMGKAVIDFINYVQNRYNVNFVDLGEIFD